MRKLSYELRDSGFLRGLLRGAASSNDVFVVDMVRPTRSRLEGLRLDRDALRGDVERAREEFRRQTGKDLTGRAPD